MEFFNLNRFRVFYTELCYEYQLMYKLLEGFYTILLNKE